MGSPRLMLSLESSAFAVSAEFSLFSLESLTSGLKAKNSSKRFRDGRRPIRIRVACPSCGAGPMQLTVVTEDRGEQRACRCCHHRFPVEC